MLSIPSYKTDDPNYRYKMPKLIAKVEGRGNGIRTNIVNMGEIAKCLKRPPDYPTKFCGHELGSQSKFETAEGKAIVNGSHEQRDLQDLIDKFIDKFVLCGSCNLPEIDLSLKRNRVVYSCNACGHQGEADNSHKLATFILKNPPDGSESTLGNKKKKVTLTKEEKLSAGKERTGKSSKKSGGDSGMSSELAPGEEKPSKSSSKPSTSKSKASKQLRPTTSTEEAASDDEGIEEKEITTRKPKKSSRLQQESKLQAVTTADITYSSPEIHHVVESLMGRLTNSNAAVRCSEASALADKAVDIHGGDNGPTSVTAPNSEKASQSRPAHRSIDPNYSPSDFATSLTEAKISMKLSDEIRIFVALRALFHPLLGEFSKELFESRSDYLVEVSKNIKYQDILAAVEEFLLLDTTGVSMSRLLPYILQELYNSDIVEASEILKYYDGRKLKEERKSRPAYKAARTAAKPFLEYLEKSESEDDGDGEEADDVEDESQPLSPLENQTAPQLETASAETPMAQVAS